MSLAGLKRRREGLMSSRGIGSNFVRIFGVGLGQTSQLRGVVRLEVNCCIPVTFRSYTRIWHFKQTIGTIVACDLDLHTTFASDSVAVVTKV